MNTVIAIDGPSASGKSTVARNVAAALPEFVYVDTGAMYRAVTWALVQARIDLTDSNAVTEFVRHMPFSCEISHFASHVRCGQLLKPEQLRSPEVSSNVSTVAAIPMVRERLLSEQRKLLHVAPLVIEGRDIGTVVFPETPFKFYLDANPEVRAARRQEQGEVDAILQRDKIDSSRAVAPLTISDNARVIDSSGMTIAEVVALILDDLTHHGIFVKRSALPAAANA